MIRLGQILVVATLVVTSACASVGVSPRPPKALASRPAHPASLDSATVTKLCENADSVRAYRAACRVGNQVY